MANKKSTLQEAYEKDVLKGLMTALNIKNKMSTPKMEKVKINVGIGTYIKNGGKDFTPILANITDISGQKPVTVNARKAISNFKLRAGMPVGVSVTLRKKRMYDFVSKLVNVALPRTRDFRGISVKGFDGKGNYTLGIKDCSIFPEISHENLERPHGLQITITTSAGNNYGGYLLLKGLGFPFKDEVKNPEEKK